MAETQTQQKYAAPTTSMIMLNNTCWFAARLAARTLLNQEVHTFIFDQYLHVILSYNL